ncbi:MAG TPA: hypothetical protein VHN99_06455, partial [Deinococcales bacterium]|nr:hypothetical protein [Deinococcales bacterium]
MTLEVSGTASASGPAGDPTDAWLVRPGEIAAFGLVRLQALESLQDQVQLAGKLARRFLAGPRALLVGLLLADQRGRDDRAQVGLHAGAEHVQGHGKQASFGRDGLVIAADRGGGTKGERERLRVGLDVRAPHPGFQGKLSGRGQHGHHQRQGQEVSKGAPLKQSPQLQRAAPREVGDARRSYRPQRPRRPQHPQETQEGQYHGQQAEQVRADVTA